MMLLSGSKNPPWYLQSPKWVSSLGQRELKGNYCTVNEGVVGAGGLGFVSAERQAIQVKDLSGNEDNIRMNSC